MCHVLLENLSGFHVYGLWPLKPSKHCFRSNQSPYGNSIPDGVHGSVCPFWSQSNCFHGAGKFKILSFCHVCFCGVVFCFCFFAPFWIRICLWGLTFNTSLHETADKEQFSSKCNGSSDTVAHLTTVYASVSPHRPSMHSKCKYIMKNVR